MVTDVRVAATFSESEIQALRTIVRIALEVSAFLRGDEPIVSAGRQLRYNLDTVISGIKSFTCLSGAYGVLVGALPSGLIWDEMSNDTLLVETLNFTQRFLDETDFMQKCRLLLDLFKLQLALVAIHYP